MTRAELGAVALFAAAGLWSAGLLAALLPNGRMAGRVSAWLAVAGALAVAVGGGAGLAIDVTHAFGAWQEIGAVSVRLDRVSGFYLLLTGVVGTAIALAMAVRSDAGDLVSERSDGALVNALLLAVTGIFVAANVFLFLLCWEAMAIAFYLSVRIREGERDDRPALWTFDLSKLGTALVLAAFLLLASRAGSFQIADLARVGGTLPGVVRSVAFVLFFAGFGVKVGMAPVHVWLRRAYPRAATLVSALLAAVVFNVGFYGLERSLFEWLGAPPAWWGIALLLIGGCTAFGGILYAATQVELKAFLAYSSMENAGFILVALGVALLGRADGLSLLAGAGLVAALYQITVHSCAKALLFIGVQGVEEACGDTRMDRLGGLAKHLPGTSLLFSRALSPSRRFLPSAA